jgi:hypothetical protein
MCTHVAFVIQSLILLSSSVNGFIFNSKARALQAKHLQVNIYYKGTGITSKSLKNLHTYKSFNIFGQMPFILFFIKQSMRIKSNYTQQLCFVFPKKTYTPAGFEPGSSVPELVAMSTVPRHPVKF